ncbi:MAG: DUF308 domain-containing protein [Oscillibacter sp.]|nr:DUF308 domain-containing protein [Oscillibacter sp.]
MNKWKLARGGYLVMAGIFYLAGAVQLLFSPIGSHVLVLSTGSVLIAYGVIKIIGYFSRDLYCLAFQYDLASGLFLIVLGVLLLSLLPSAAQLMPYLTPGLGLLLALDSLLSVQMSADARRFGLETWPVVLAVSLTAFGFGLLLLAASFRESWNDRFFAGLALLAEGAKTHCVVRCTVKLREPPQPLY